MPPDRQPPAAPWADDDETSTLLSQRLPASTLWSLLLGVFEKRAAARTPAALMHQWSADRFVAPAAVDPRLLLEIDRQLFIAAAAFEAIELSPLAPLGSCSALAPTSQNRNVSTIRGTEVVSDPTNVLALASAQRLRRDPGRTVRLATSHRCVRAQPVPQGPGFAAHFRMFAMTSAGHEVADQAFVVAAITEHIVTHLAALDRLEAAGCAFGARTLTLLATAPRAHLARRIGAAVTTQPVVHARLEQPYYDGLRFTISVRAANGNDVPLCDGGAFDWLGRLAANRKLAFVASAIGTQLAAAQFGAPSREAGSPTTPTPSKRRR